MEENREGATGRGGGAEYGEGDRTDMGREEHDGEIRQWEADEEVTTVGEEKKEGKVKEEEVEEEEAQ